MTNQKISKNIEPKTANKVSDPSTDQDNSKTQNNKYAFFIGCTIQNKIPYIEKLSRQIFKDLNIKLIDLDFSCCPTSRVVRDVNINSWLTIAARNIAVAEKTGLPILSMCTGCTQTLTEAKHTLDNDKDLRNQINEKLAPLGLIYEGTSEIKFYAQLIFELSDQTRKLIKNPLQLNIASHSGCHILRPSNILNFDNPENPTKLNDLIKLLGADPINYGKKAMCCGYPIYSVDPVAAGKIMKDKINSIHSGILNNNQNNPSINSNCDCLTVLCPTCFEYFSLRQNILANQHNFTPIFVIHFLQLLGLSFGYSKEQIGWNHMRHKDEEFLKKFNLHS